MALCIDIVNNLKENLLVQFCLFTLRGYNVTRASSVLYNSALLHSVSDVMS